MKNQNTSNTGELFDRAFVIKELYFYLKRNERKGLERENIILKYLRKSFRMRSKGELDEMFIDMKYDIDQIKEDPFEQNALDAFNILTWFESKIRKGQ